VLYSLSLLIMVVMTVSVMARIDWGLTLWSLAPLPFMSIGVYYVSAIIHRRSEEVQAGQSDLSAMVQQNFSGIRVLAAYARETAALLRFSTAADLYKERSLKLVKVEALFIPLIVMLVGLSTVLTIYIGGLRVLDGRLEMGHIFQFIFYINLLTWPFASVGWVTSLVQKAAASQGRINAFLDLEPEIQSDAAPHEVKGRITFENVGLTYPDSGIRALEGVSFDLEAGQTLGIVGRTGSGKSTVAQLIARLYDADTGRVLIDGRLIQDCDLGSLRGAMGYAPQDVFLFSDSIHNNIAFGSAGATAEEVEAAAKEAAVHEDIAGFPEGYQTLLGERGVNLSGGQKQRIAIARALLASPAILVLDDVLSAVDTATEAYILKALEGVRRGRTAVMISHRVSTVAGADLLIVLDAGRVVERGTHEELLSLKGEYYKMHIRDTARRTR
jgi:ATP-binding cassette subfamily B multidrug efflux pump